MIPNWDFDTVKPANPTKSRPEASFIQKQPSPKESRSQDRRPASPTRAVSPLAPVKPVPAQPSQPAPSRPAPSPAAAAAAVAATSAYNNDRVPLDPPSDPAPEPPKEPAPVIPKPKPASPKGSGEKSASLYDVVAPILSEMKTQYKYQDCVSYYLPSF